MMVNNSTNNTILWWSTIPPIATKRTITSHFISLNIKKDHHMWPWKSRSSLGTATTQTVGVLNWLIRPEPSHLDIQISNSNTYLNKRYKIPAQIRFHSTKPHTITKMIDDIDMDHGQYNRKVEYAYYIHLLLEQKVISDN